MAEGVFADLVEKSGLSSQIEVDSAGTAAYHVGEKADVRTLKVLQEHGIELTSRARQATREDFETFDYILAMDYSNMANLMAISPKASKAEVILFREFDPTPENKEVPDPYYGGDQGFHNVHRMVKRTSEVFLDHITTKHAL